jgi:diaminopimelate epimerase
MRWFKAHGLGNDYLVATLAELPFELTSLALRMLCDRHRGVGADGILLQTASAAADFGVRIFNPDGSEAEKSGNGLRIFGAYLDATDQLRGRRFTVETRGGAVGIEVLARGTTGEWMIAVEMGRASFRSADIGLIGPDRDTGQELLELPSGERIDCSAVSLGNPHCVVFQDELDTERLREIAPLISNHPWFQRGTNVQFARIDSPATVEAWVWERGAGETLASGSSACAVAAVAVRRGLVSERRLEVLMPGGTLHVEVAEDWQIRQRGPVEDVCWLELADGMQRRLRS